ncbi:MAG: hypothetical protein QOD00_698 [Blastocatellia bacterium]|jgi:nucleoside-diphosphate-sugar epimerase|nr:hypothetical protein [Blastocatellia bacterium]
MLVLLTGGTGFIGARLLEKLLARDHVVRVLVRPEKAKQFSRRRNVETVVGTLADARILAESMNGVDTVYHLAWQSNRRNAAELSEGDKAEEVRANISGARILLRASVTSEARRFIYTSTVSVYDNSLKNGHPISEDHPLAHEGQGGRNIHKQYTEPKIEVENMIRRFSNKYGLEYVILRPAIVYGAGAPFAEDWVRRSLRAQWSAGGAGRFQPVQLVHVDDVVDALLLAGTEARAANQEFNVAGAEAATEAQLQLMIKMIAARLRRGLPPAEWPARHLPNLQRRDLQRYDLTKAKSLLKYAPKVSLREGLEEMVSAVLGEDEPRGGEQNGGGEEPPGAGGGRGFGGAARLLRGRGARLWR